MSKVYIPLCLAHGNADSTNQDGDSLSISVKIDGVPCPYCEIEALKAEVNRLRGVLAFYSDGDNRAWEALNKEP